MTGIKVSTRRDTWVQVDVDELSEMEFRQYAALEKRYGSDGWELAWRLLGWIRDHAGSLSSPTVGSSSDSDRPA
jgi:hypothetical protein